METYNIKTYNIKTRSMKKGIMKKENMKKENMEKENMKDIMKENMKDTIEENDIINIYMKKGKFKNINEIEYDKKYWEKNLKWTKQNI